MIQRFDDFESMKKFEAENKIEIRNIFGIQSDRKYSDGKYCDTHLEYILVYVKNGKL